MNIKPYFPLAEQLSSYTPTVFKDDMVAGLTVWILLVPQAMAYALLAGMPPIYGLYGSLIPPLVYGIMGTCRQLSLGPVASSSLVILAGISQLAEPETPHYIELVILTGGLIGLGMLLLGLLRLGFLSVLLSQPVIVGFTAAAGVIIGVSQLKYLFGIDIPRFGQSYETIIYAFQHIEETHWLTFAFCSGGVLSILAMKHWLPKVPGTLVVSVVSIVVTYLLGLEQYGLEMVKDVPQGLPHFDLPVLGNGNLNAVFPTVMVGIVIGVVENISIAKALELKTKAYKVRPDQELLAAGASRFLGGLFQGLPVSASFTRSALNYEAGAKTGLSSVILAIMMGLTLLFLTPLVYYLPKAILGAIVFMAVKSLIEVGEAKRLWRIRRRDFLMMLATFFATLLISIEMGVVVGIVLSLALVLLQASRPHIAILGQLPGSREFRNVERFPDARELDDVVVARFDAPLYYLNADYFKTFIHEAIQTHAQCKLLILDCSSISDIDTNGLNALQELHDELKIQGIELSMAGLIGPARDLLNTSGLTAQIGVQHQFLNIYDAVQFFKADGSESDDYWSEAAIQFNHKKNKSKI